MPIKNGDALPSAVRTCEVLDAQGNGHIVHNLIDGRPSLLLFIRHFGCIGCSENVGVLAPRFHELAQLHTQVILIGCGPALFIDGFRERHNLLHAPAQVFTDPSLSSHQAAGLRYGIMGGFSPKAIWEMGRAFVNGHTSDRTQGDIRQHAGALLIDGDGVVRLYHRNTTLGDHANGQSIVDAALSIWLKANPDIA